MEYEKNLAQEREQEIAQVGHVFVRCALYASYCARSHRSAFVRCALYAS